MKTTLELVLCQSGGALRVSLKCAAVILGVEVQTIRNRLSRGDWPLRRHVEGRRVFFHARDLANFVDGNLFPNDADERLPAPRRGRPPKALLGRG